MPTPRLALAAPLLALAALTGCSSEEARRSPYDVYLVRGCAADLDHTEYDPALPGYWFVGTEGTLQVSLAKDAAMPEKFVFMIKTRATADEQKPSRLDKVLILTPRYRVITGFAAGVGKPVDILALMERKEGTEIIPVESDKEGRYIAFEQVGERVKITVTRKGLEMLGRDLTLTWGETPEGGKPGQPASEKAAERGRRLM